MNLIEFYSALRDYEGALVTGIVTGGLIGFKDYIGNSPLQASAIGLGLAMLDLDPSFI